MSLTIDKVYSFKGKAISDFAFVEVIISKFVAIHYLGVSHEMFFEEVLEHDYFSFELKKRILYKILKTHYPKLPFPNKELDRLQFLRNLFVHGVMAGRMGTSGKIKPFLRHQGKDHDIKNTFDEWNKIVISVKSAVKSLPNINSKTEEGVFEL